MNCSHPNFDIGLTIFSFKKEITIPPKKSYPTQHLWLDYFFFFCCLCSISYIFRTCFFELTSILSTCLTLLFSSTWPSQMFILESILSYMLFLCCYITASSKSAVHIRAYMRINLFGFKSPVWIACLVFFP